MSGIFDNSADNLGYGMVRRPDTERSEFSIIERSGLPELLERINDEYSVILRGSQALIMRHWVGQDGQSKLVFLNKRDFLLLQENNKLWIDEGGGSKKPIKLGQAWLEWPKRSSYEEVYFEPEGGSYSRRYNLWRGFAVVPRECADTSRFSIFLNHIRDNICQGNELYYSWVMAWLADLFQNPSRKIGTALVLRGPMGVGKGVFANHIGRLLGIHYMPITQSSQLTGKFNGHMADKLLMFVDEGWWSDEQRGAGILRALITEAHVTIEMKGRDAVTIPNFTRFIIASNADWVVRLGMGDERRFLMLDVGTKAQRNIEYFKAMQDQLESGGYQELLYYLLNYKYDETLARTILQTEALKENKIYSMSDELKWWHECLVRERIGKFRLEDNEKNNIETDRFHLHYQEWCEKMQVRPLSANALPKKLKVCVDLNRRQKYTKSSGRLWFYYLPFLTVMRESFERFVGYRINWEDI